MNRALRWAVIGLAACTSVKRGDPAARFAGTWDGRWLDSPDTRIRWRGITSVAQDGALTGSLVFAKQSMVVPLRALDVTDSTVLLELGRHVSPVLGVPAVTRMAGQLRGDSLRGTFEVQPIDGATSHRGRFAAVRRPPPQP